MTSTVLSPDKTPTYVPRCSPEFDRPGSPQAGNGPGRQARTGGGACPPFLCRGQFHRRLYYRTGQYPLQLPDGSDAVGVVEAVGPEVTDIRVGDRVGYLIGPQSAYSDVRIVPADVLIPISETSGATVLIYRM